MDVLFLDAPYTGKVELCKDTVSYLHKNKYKTVALYASVQFCNQLTTVREQLAQAGINIITSKADRTHVAGQLLGCNSYHQSLNLKDATEMTVDCFLYIGDGRFHPLALAYAQKDLPQIKEIVCDDPLRQQMNIIGLKDIRRTLMKYRAFLLKFLTSQKIGIIITIKPGQEQLRPSFALEKKYPAKKFYYFLDNTLSFDQLENFNFVEMWVNTACPRIGFDDLEKFRKGVINLTDALQAEVIVSSFQSLDQNKDNQINSDNYEDNKRTKKNSPNSPRSFSPGNRRKKGNI